MAAIRTWLIRNQGPVGHAVRVSVGAICSLAVALYFRLPMPLWAVLTAIIVTQMNLGRSLKAAADYLVGTLGGAVFGALVATTLPHAHEASLLLVLAVAVAPLTLVASLKPSLAAAPITGALIILLPMITHVSPAVSAVDRVLEVLLGGVIGFLVSFAVLPSNALRLAVDAAAQALDRMAKAFGELMVGLDKGLDVAALHRIQDHIGQALVQLDAIGMEADRERRARLTEGPNTKPLLNTLLRLRHDLVMIGRVAIVPFGEPFRSRLQPALAQVTAAMIVYFHESAAALRGRHQPPSIEIVDEAMAAYSAEMMRLRGEGLVHELPMERAERFFALAFALEQMHRNFVELEKQMKEWAEPGRRYNPLKGPA